MLTADTAAGVEISNKTTALSLAGLSQVAWRGILSGTGNTTIFSLSKGARAQLSSGSTIAGTTEIVLDGAAGQLISAMRAASPKLLTNSYGTIIYE